MSSQIKASYNNAVQGQLFSYVNKSTMLSKQPLVIAGLRVLMVELPIIAQ